MSNVGKRGKLKLESRLRAALLNGTNTRLEHHEIKRVIDALLKPPAREEAQPVKTMTLNLSDAEIVALEGVMASKDMSAPAVFRNSFRLYQMVDRGLASVTVHEAGPLGLPSVIVTTPPAPEAEKLDPAIPAAVKSMLDRFDRAKGKGGYPTANERWAMRECLAALQAEQGAK